ncbi:MAG: DUF2326 domain-containing protein [Candidatus Stahlbacteria bacterium]|nr:MAG: DUF2326 domain-containing protein [Candidatus Stahlbacteria bacterium]
MIHRIFSKDLESFKEVTFHEGLNILVATKTKEEDPRKTRNRSGKTSLIEIMHFLLGGKCGTDSIFRLDDLISYTFGMEFDLGDSVVTVQRSGSNPNELIVRGGIQDWPISPYTKDDSNERFISNTDWRVVLGHFLFDLSGSASEEKTGKFGPSFRSLISYFIRNENAGGFLTAEKQSKNQQLGDVQVNLSYLLDLDWTISQELQFVREREKEIAVLRRELSKGTFGPVVGTAAQLQTALALAEEKTSAMKKRGKEFRVRKDYHELEKEASELTQQLADLADGNTIDYELISELERSLKSEESPSLENLERLYMEVGVELPDTAVRRFEDVRKFHEAVIENRKSYLVQEIEAARRRIANRERRTHRLDVRRAQIMTILKSSGALESYTNLRSELTRLEAETESLRNQLLIAERLEGEKTELEMERAQLLTRLRQNHQEQRVIVNKAIQTFEGISQRLYEKPGSLTIERTLNGPIFDFIIQGKRSKGIRHMLIFCFDLMLVRLCKRCPGFLVHDSHLFDSVDSDQTETAFQIADEATKKFGFQYIFTLNSHKLPKRIELSHAILPVSITDATEDGGLFGFRFG